MLKSVVHGNSVTVTHGLDPHAMRRPGSIATSGVTGTPGNWASGAYAYDGAGNITRIGEEWFTYDLVSRLAANSYPMPEGECPTSLQSLAYTYDPLGNMTSWTYNCSGTHTYSVDASTNRLTTQDYDFAGNALTTVGEANAETLAYYHFNDLRSAVGTGLNRLYGYTADGERLVDYDAQPNPPAGPFTITLRDLGGKVLRAFQVTTGQPGTWTEKEDWITRDGQLLATVDTTVQGGVARHVHLDHLGTPRLITSASGAGLESHTYLPFGLEVTELGPLSERMKFTGHERDLASGLDYMHARYYSQYVNRFLSVDKGRAKPGSPQGWNRYAYARGNPLNRIDLDGLEDVLVFKTERNPRRDPADPWGKAAAYLANKYTREFSGKYNNLDVRIIEVNRVSQVNSALSSARDVVKVSLIGHSDQSSIFVGSESKPDTNISSQGGPNDVDPRNLNWSNLKREATIDIMGCHAGDGPGSIAQDIANAAGVPVTAPDSFLNFDETTGEPFIRWYRFGEFVTSEPSEPEFQQ